MSAEERAAMVAASRGPAPTGHNRLVVPAATITAAVTGQPEPAADRPAVSPIEALIARSQMSDRARVRALGAKIVSLVAELRGLFQVDEAEQKAVERHDYARRYLASRDLTVDINLTAGTGVLLAGVFPAGHFTVEELVAVAGGTS